MNAEFRDSIRKLSQVVENQAGQQRVDTKNFMEEMQKVIEVMLVDDAERAELTACLLKGVARIRVVRGRPSWKNVNHQVSEVPNASKVQPPQGEVTNVEFQDTIQKLSPDVQIKPANKEWFVKMWLTHPGSPIEEDKLKDMEKFRRTCRDGSNGFFKYDQTGHLVRECPNNRQGNRGNEAQSSSVAPVNRGTLRGSTSGEGGDLNHLYAITSRQQQENSPDVVTGMIKVSIFDVYAFFDPGASLSFVTLCSALRFDILSE
uniref:Gag-pol protein n=1 Tax=Solanum tuberosum TaxID=4113 RepID=M1DXV4_SOLTU